MAFLLEIVRLGLKNLALHKLRSVLTSLGIILGVAAVIVMVAIGEGNKQAALREIESLGATNIIVRSIKPPESATFGAQTTSFVVSYGILREDLRRLRHFMSDAVNLVPLKAVGDEITYREYRVVSQAFGTTPELKDVTSLRIARGRYLADSDMDGRMAVAVIGDGIADQFFKLRDPLGEEIRIGDQVFRVIGVLRPVGLAGGAGSALVGRDLNMDIHVPITTAELVFGDQVIRRISGTTTGEEVQVSEVYVEAANTQAVLNTAERVEQLMKTGHPELRDIQLIVPWELLEQVKKTTMVMNIMLISIAAISLLVGGIGIMNIMLASVTERTREIGIRRALGATRRHITAQFLVETGTLSAGGGLAGILVGVGFSWGIDIVLPWFLSLRFMRQYFDPSASVETAITAWSILASFIVAAMVGLVFGIYPAVVASRQDPIVALRHD